MPVTPFEPTGALDGRFAEAMERLGPYGPAPLLALAVSGGADSTALAVLARGWAATHHARLIALIADHGLRSESKEEAVLTASRLAAMDIPARIIALDIAPGPALQERARAARHEALAGHAAACGAVHLLLGHHAADQAEGIAMRAARGPGGAAGMAGFAARHAVVLLRPLLDIDPAELRGDLRRRGNMWIEDPSNRDRRFERVRIRLDRPAETPVAVPPPDHAACLAGIVRLDPACFALIRADRLPPAALAALIRTIGGAVYPPSRAGVERLAAALRPATLGGVRIMAAGKLGDGWLLVREAAACRPDIAAQPGAVWDGRFRVRAIPPGGQTIGPLGACSPQVRRLSPWPAAILRSLPAFFSDGAVVAVPHLQAAWRGTIGPAPPAPVTLLRTG